MAIKTISTSTDEQSPVFLRAEEPPETNSHDYYSDVARAPIDMLSTALKTAKAYLFHDEAGRIEWMGKLVNAMDLSISVTSIALRSVAFIALIAEDTVLSHFLPMLLGLLVAPLAIIGLTLSFFEAVYEIYNLVKIAQLRGRVTFNKTTISEEDLQNPTKFDMQVQKQKANLDAIERTFLKLYPHQEEKISNFITEKLGITEPSQRRRIFNHLQEKARDIKLQNMERRLSPALAKTIQEALLLTRSQLDSKDRKLQLVGLSKADCLMHDVDTQTRKKLAIHITGLISIAVYVVGYALLLTGLVHIAPILLGLTIAGVLFCVIRYLLDKGTFHQEGWKFSLKDCLPKFIANRLYADDKTETSEKPKDISISHDTAAEPKSRPLSQEERLWLGM